MRLSKTAKLDDSRTVTVRELRVKDVRNFVASLDGDLGGMDFAKLLKDEFDDLAGRLAGCVELPDGENLDDLSFGEIDQLWQAFREVNAPFFGLLARLGLDLSMRTVTEPTSTAPAAPSSSEATAASGTTDGLSS
ncbi:MAG: hypothetical protein ABFS30_10240 [Pseudomonadota bacterium]